jgi:hypothetical protein
VRGVLRRATKAQARAEELQSVVERARHAVEEAFEAARESQVRAELAKMSLDAVKDVTEGRVRLTGLAEHGFVTVADVLHAGRDGLAQVPGVGEASATRLVAAAEQLRDAARESLAFRIDLDPTDAQSTRLLQALAVWAAVRNAAGVFEHDAGQLAKELADDRPVAAGAGRFRRLFVGSRRRRVADEAVGRIATRVREAAAGGLLTAVKDVRKVRPPSPAQV